MIDLGYMADVHHMQGYGVTDEARWTALAILEALTRPLARLAVYPTGFGPHSVTGDGGITFQRIASHLGGCVNIDRHGRITEAWAADPILRIESVSTPAEAAAFLASIDLPEGNTA